MDINKDKKIDAGEFKASGFFSDLNLEEFKVILGDKLKFLCTDVWTSIAETE